MPNIRRLSVEVTRPANTTAYAAGDGISDATSSPANISVDGVGNGYIVGAFILTDEPDLTPTIKLHLYRTAPAQIVDNAACTAPLYADVSIYQGAIDLGPLSDQDVTGDDSSYAQDMVLRHPTGCDKLFFIIQTLNAFTPTSSQKFTIVLLVEVG